MQLAVSEAQQQQMRDAYRDGAPGIFVSGLVWITAAVVSFQMGTHKGVWTLLSGGALIYPLASILEKIMGLKAKTDKNNALNQLAMASTIWLIIGCAMSYGLFLLAPVLFFPAMMATIGSRYLIFASIFGKAVYWVLGACLIIAANLTLFLNAPPAIAAAVGGLIEIALAFWVFSKAVIAAR